MFDSLKSSLEVCTYIGVRAPPLLFYWKQLFPIKLELDKSPPSSFLIFALNSLYSDPCFA